MVRFRLLLAIPIFFFAVVGVLIFFTDPFAPMRWFLGPQYKKEAIAFLGAVSGGDYEKASKSLIRNARDAETGDAVKSQWISAMHELKEQGFYPVEYSNLKVPHDREHMDGQPTLRLWRTGSGSRF